MQPSGAVADRTKCATVGSACSRVARQQGWGWYWWGAKAQPPLNGRPGSDAGLGSVPLACDVEGRSEAVAYGEAGAAGAETNQC